MASRNLAFRASLLVRLAAILTAAIGVLVLAGWTLDLPVLKSVLPGAVEMKANAALGFILAGGALFLLRDRLKSPKRQRFSQALALAIGLLGLATLSEYAFNLQLGIDELLFRDSGGAYNLIRGRMSPYTAAGFLSIAVGLAALPRSKLAPVVWAAATIVIVIGVVSVLGYLWNARELVTDIWAPPVAVHTAVAFIVLGAGVLIESLLSDAQFQGPLPALAAVETKVLGALAGTLVALIIGGGYLYRRSAAFDEAAPWLVHTTQVEYNLRELYAATSDAVTAERGYFITGTQESLQAYYQRSAAARYSLEAVRRLVAENQPQAQAVAELERLTAEAFDRMAQAIALFQQGKVERAHDLIRSGQSARTLSAIKSVVERIEAEEAKLVNEKQMSVELSRQKTLILLLVTLAAAFAAVIVLFRGIRGEIAARAKAEQAKEEKKAEVLRLNEALQQRAAEADSASRAKSTFLATMSHEIRTPMNGMLGTLELLSLTRLDADQRATLEIVRDSSKSLLRIIDDILDFSKIEAGKLEVRPEVCSVKKLIQEVHSIYGGNASSNGVLIKREVDPRISPAVRVDPLRLRQILNNFVSNALKFTAQGSIEIKAEWIERINGTDRVRFSVKDTGIGISAQDQQHLFEPFTQGSGEAARRAGGTGLGLTICRRLSEMMGGTIEMSSEVGTGTTMSLILPLPIAHPDELRKDDAMTARDLPTPPRRRSAPSVSEAEDEGTLVLLVDDHPTNRALLMRQVKTLGYAAETAENGIEGLDKWKSGRFALVITDCHMPEMNGYELARSIRRIESENGGKHIPIIACTANAFAGEFETCLAAGMDDYLVKPVELSGLLKKLDRWLPISRETDVVAQEPVERPARSGPPSIDLSVITATWGGDESNVRTILAEFRLANDRDANMLRRAVAANDISQATHAAHRMLGASKMVGAEDFAIVCEHLDVACRANDWETVMESMAAFEEECLRLNAYIDTQCNLKNHDGPVF